MLGLVQVILNNDLEGLEGGLVIDLIEWFEELKISENVGTPLGPCIARHFNNKVPGCLDATIKIGIKVTVFR